MSRNPLVVSTLWRPLVHTARIIGKRMHPLNWTKYQQGAQEMARRVRQMQRNAANQARREAYWSKQS